MRDIEIIKQIKKQINFTGAKIPVYFYFDIGALLFYESYVTESLLKFEFQLRLNRFWAPALRNQLATPHNLSKQKHGLRAGQKQCFE